MLKIQSFNSKQSKRISKLSASKISNSKLRGRSMLVLGPVITTFDKKIFRSRFGNISGNVGNELLCICILRGREKLMSLTLRRIIANNLNDVTNFDSSSLLLRRIESNIDIT